MDKLRRLKGLIGSQALSALDLDEMRLYLLLFANSGRKWEGVIAFKSIKNALGKRFTLNKLKNACHKLQECGLIGDTSLGNINNKGIRLTYKMLINRR